MGDSPEEDEEKKRTEGKRVPLTWRDYVALYIAALQTVLLPFVILVVVLFFVVLIIAGHL